MSTIRWMIYQECKKRFGDVDVNITFGHITKSARIKNGIEKSHTHDAFVIAGGSNKHQIAQSRLSNRSLQKFYDKKVADIRTGEVVKGATLDCGRRTRNQGSENLRVYRGASITKGRVSIRQGKSRYQPNDIVIFKGRKFTVKACHNKNTRVILKENHKSVAIKNVQSFSFKKAITWNIQLKATASI